MSPSEKLVLSVAAFPAAHFAPGKFVGKYWADDENPTLAGGWTRSQETLHEEPLSLTGGREFLCIEGNLWLNEVTVSGIFPAKEILKHEDVIPCDGHPFTSICDLMSEMVAAEPIVAEVYEGISLELWMTASANDSFQFACHLHSVQLRRHSEHRDIRIKEMRRAAEPIDRIKMGVEGGKSLVDWDHAFLKGVTLLSAVRFYRF